MARKKHTPEQIINKSGRTVRWVTGRRHQKRRPYQTNHIPTPASGLIA